MTRQRLAPVAAMAILLAPGLAAAQSGTASEPGFVGTLVGALLILAFGAVTLFGAQKMRPPRHGMQQASAYATVRREAADALRPGERRDGARDEGHASH